MSALPKIRWTEAEYLAFERASQDKHEFIDGEVLAMSGASKEHNIITGNVYSTLRAKLRGRGCSVYFSDVRVRVSRRRDYVYPDVTVTCGTESFADDQKDTLLNPTVIIEVLSPSTERYDRGDKFERYRTIESFQEYILIAQDRILIEQHIRQPDDRWITTYVQQPDGVIELPSIGCQLSVAEVYEQITFEESPSDENIEA